VFDRVDITGDHETCHELPYFIADTGSSDGTVKLISAHLESNRAIVTGRTHFFPWIDDFGKAKAFALNRSREAGCDHIIFLDADEEVWTSEKRILNSLEERARFADYLDAECTGECVVQTTESSGAMWWRLFAISATVRGTFRGSRHEYVDAGLSRTTYLPAYFVYARRDQTRLGREKNALFLDALALERDIARGENVARALYYAGQSYEQAGDVRRALEMYRRRVANTDGWHQERFVAQWHVGMLVENHFGFNASIVEYFEAINIDADRAEPYYYLAKGFRLRKNFVSCYSLAREGAAKKFSSQV
jgi:tetratricopeptide (TPR) repeat protein